ncbi:MAG TPA: ABC transporter ATP-binding protein [Thermoanaerobaculia bacterium]|nr:ABC transporter ATP-binding protein [Thermoanaerobaculia bacterium]
MTGVRVRALRKSFAAVRRRQEVLKGVDLALAPGEVVGLVGPNGAGKTTLMSCLLGFLQPDSGEITIDDRPNDDLRVRAVTGFVPERMNFDRRATGFVFLRYMARLAGVKNDDRVHAMLERLGIANAANKRLSQYSRGMLQRIGMAQALIHEPQYVFLDEPTSGLDPNGVLLVRDLIVEQKKRGATVLLNSHQLSEVEKVCDRVFFLSGGVIAREETLRQIDRIAVAVTLLPGFDATRIAAFGAVDRNVLIATVEDEAAIAALVRAIVESGAGVVDVRRHAADLESIFRGEA